MSESHAPDAYAEEGQLPSNEGADINNDNDDNDGMDDLMPSDFATPGGPTPGGPMNDDDDEMNDKEDDSNTRNNVDLCILCDVTDSMGLWIEQIKTGIRRIVNELKNTFGIGTLRVSFIGYRDWDDDENNKGYQRIEKLPFTSDMNTFESFLKNVEAVAGGDAAEDVLGGIQETIHLSWNAPIRVVYHICDAPPHGTMYHDLYDSIQKEEASTDLFSWENSDVSDSDNDEKDDELILMKGDYTDNAENNETEQQILRDEFDKWPDKYPKDPDHEDLFLALQQKNIQFYIGTQTKFTDKMVNVFQDYCDSIDYKFTTMDLMNVTQFLPTLIEAVSDAIRVVFPLKKEEIHLNLEVLQQKKVNFQVHCGIDFGTAGSGFAYALPGKNEVYTDQNWNAKSQHVDVKTKTNILLDPEGNCIAFGDDATDKYTHTDTNDLFFERFKMALYDNQDNDDHEDEKESMIRPLVDNEQDNRVDIVQMLTAANGKQLPSRKVLEEAIRFMKEHAMKNLQKKVNKNLKVQDVQWILTVPAIWSDRAKSVMRTAAINAGMVDPDIEGHLVIAYEPDCASLSIQNEINEKARAMRKQQRKMKNEKLKAIQNVADHKNDEDSGDEDDQDSFFQCGDKILLCDLGGGTADIACHEIDENERIRQIVAPSGGAWGSTYVDQYFLELLEEMLSKAWMDEFKLKHPSTYIEFLQNFRASKKTYKAQDKKKVKTKQLDTTFHNISIPFTFLDFMAGKADDSYEEDEAGDDDPLEWIVCNFEKLGKKGLIQLEEDYLKISYTLWNYLFNIVVDPIVAHCKKLLDLPEMNGCKYLCLVGGFSDSKHLKSVIFSNFGKKSEYDIMIYTPQRPILSVVNGAARMGLRPDFISARTVAKTYGIAIQKDLFEFKGIFPNALVPKVKISKRLVYARNNKKKMISKQVVNDVFLPFVRRNTLIRSGDKPIVYWVEPADVTTNKISIKLYDSLECDPMFVDGKEANRIEIELSEKYMAQQQAIPVIFIFNDTTIRVFTKVKDDDGNEQTKEVTLNFDVVP